jgi:predicted DNA-binding WGR domain protein
VNWNIHSRIEDYLGRLEFVEGKSNKFWECLRDGDHPGNYATRWGRIGAKKTTHSTKFNMTQSEAAEKIGEKLKKGYRLVEKSRDVMQARWAEEGAARLSEMVPQVAAQAPVAVNEAPRPAARPARL